MGENGNQAQAAAAAAVQAPQPVIYSNDLSGIKNPSFAHVPVRKKLLNQDMSKLTLDQAIEFARTFEATESQLNLFSDTSSVSAIHQKSNGKKQCGYCGGKKHPRDDCPAKNQKCNKCHKIGHWAKVCKSKARSKSKSRQQPQSQKKTNEITATDDQICANFSSVTFDSIQRSEAFATIPIEPQREIQTNLKGKVDTGAQGNILPLRTFKKIFPQRISKNGMPTNTSPSSITLTAYNGTEIKQFGTVNILCGDRENKKYHSTEFYVVETDGPVIFGLPTCVQLNLVKMNCGITTTTSKSDGKTEHISSVDDLQKHYPDRFQGIGKFPTEQKLYVSKDAMPTRHAPRKAPVQLRDQIKAELDRMKSLDVIRPVTEPTDWVSSITYVQKNDGSLRICIDPSDLNKALKRGQHHIPTVEELNHLFAGATVFSKLDARSGYWSVPLESDSQLLTTFNSPFGRYCFKRLPFGLSVSQDIFQAAMDDVLEGLPGVVSIADDIVVFGRNADEHNTCLHKLMTRASAKGLVFNSAKCKINTKQVEFFGNIYSKHGVSPDPAKVQAIKDIAMPTNAAEVQSFIGMITYLAPFIPMLSEHNAPLRQLLKKESDFQWHSEHTEAFEKLKQLISDASHLAYFDTKKESTIQVDASQYALGAALIQENKVIAYASKALTKTEQRYANIERELLACVFGAERFHTYIYGKSFSIESDHKPLQTISKKSLNSAPARLQRMLLRLQKYDYNIRYKPGHEMILPDSLSRLPMNAETEHEEIHLNVKICYVQFGQLRLQELREASRNDPILNRLSEYILFGFPERRSNLHKDLHDYWSFRDELSLDDGLVVKGNRIIVPAALQDYYLSRIHEGHQGIVRCQERAKSTVFWPGMNKAIQQLVQQCEICQKFQPSQPKEPLIPVAADVPNIPWHTITTDLFYLNGKEYLIIVDYHSKYPIVEKLTNASSDNVAKVTSKVFSLFGVPQKIVSDNGPQFIGHAYQQLMKRYDITHITSSPHHSQSHGMVERSIRTIKGLMKKSELDTDQALLIYRTTSSGNQPSPSELLFGRKILSNLPIRVQGSMPDDVREKSRDMKQTPTSKELSELHLDQPIFYQDVAKRTWSPGVIIGCGPEPRSYTVKCEQTGQYLRRNRVLLRPRTVTFTQPMDPEMMNVTQEFQQNSPKPDLPRERPNPTPPQRSSPGAPPGTPQGILQASSQDQDVNTPRSLEPEPSPPNVVREPTKTSVTTSASTPKGYITRSGRVSKPPQRLVVEDIVYV